MRILTILGVALAVAAAAPAAEAATADVVVTIEEIGGAETLFTASGSLETNTLPNKLFPSLSSAFSVPSQGFFGVGETGNADFFFFPGSRVSYGTGGGISPGTATGPLFELGNNALRIAVDYQSGESFTSTKLVSGSFLDLGITAGATALYTLGNQQTISLEVLTPTPIPLPASLPLALAGVGALAALKRRRARG